LLSAQLGQPENQFDRINIMSNANQLSFFVFNQSGHMVQTEFEDSGFSGVVHLGIGDFFLSLGQ
jgi:hypothetical protein